jgi:hypothetical protein
MIQNTPWIINENNKAMRKNSERIKEEMLKLNIKGN